MAAEVTGRAGAGLALHLIRLAGDDLSDLLLGRSVLILFHSLRAQSGTVADVRLASLVRTHGLTAAELAVLRAMVDGDSPARIAAQRGSSCETVRSQLRALHAKTGTHGQADLIRLVLGLRHPPDGG